MRNLLLSAFALVCLLPMNAQTVNTRIYPAEKLAKVKAMPKRSQAPALSRVWRQNGANLSQNLLPHHYRNLRASKTTFIFETS